MGVFRAQGQGTVAHLCSSFFWGGGLTQNVLCSSLLVGEGVGVLKPLFETTFPRSWRRGVEAKPAFLFRLERMFPSVCLGVQFSGRR